MKEDIQFIQVFKIIFYTLRGFVEVDQNIGAVRMAFSIVCLCYIVVHKTIVRTARAVHERPLRAGGDITASPCGTSRAPSPTNRTRINTPGGRGRGLPVLGLCVFCDIVSEPFIHGGGRGKGFRSAGVQQIPVRIIDPIERFTDDVLSARGNKGIAQNRYTSHCLSPQRGGASC